MFCYLCFNNRNFLLQLSTLTKKRQKPQTNVIMFVFKIKNKRDFGKKNETKKPKDRKMKNIKLTTYNTYKNVLDTYYNATFISSMHNRVQWYWYSLADCYCCFSVFVHANDFNFMVTTMNQ